MVRIKVHAAGLNFKDAMHAVGALPVPEGAGAAHLGLECAGIVVAVGANVDRQAVHVGDPVVALGSGLLASHVLVPQQRVLVLPHTWSAPSRLSLASALPVAYLTALFSLHHGARVQPHDHVLVHSACGGVGLAALHLLQRIGATVYATVGTPEKRAFLIQRGIPSDRIFNSRSTECIDRVLDATGGRGVDVVLNSLAGDLQRRSLDALAPFGRFVEIGKRDMVEGGSLPLQALENNIHFIAVDLFQVLQLRRDLGSQLLDEFRRLIYENEHEHDHEKEQSQGNRTTTTTTTFGMHLYPVTPYPGNDTGVRDALRSYRHGTHIGKLTIDMTSNSAGTKNDREDGIVFPTRAEASPTGASSSSSSSSSIAFSAVGTYVITGGLGGFSLATAHWMARHGAGDIVLLVRRAPADKETENGKEKEQGAAAARKLPKLPKGARVVVCDVTDYDAVLATLQGMDDIRGVVHAASVRDPVLTDRLDKAAAEAVLAPKVHGAWNLHRALADARVAAGKLDLFLLFSSATSLFAIPGEGSYAVANAHLDALAQWRQAHGQPALSVSWDIIRDAGWVAQRPLNQRVLAGNGFQGIRVKSALDTLGALLLQAQARNPSQKEHQTVPPVPAHMAIMNLDQVLMGPGAPVQLQRLPLFQRVRRAQRQRYGDAQHYMNNSNSQGKTDMAVDHHHDAHGVLSPSSPAGGAHGVQLRRVLDAATRHNTDGEAHETDVVTSLALVIRAKVAALLLVPEADIPVQQSLVAIGMDSLTAMELRTWVQREAEVRIPMSLLMTGPSLHAMAAKILELRGLQTPSSKPKPPHHQQQPQQSSMSGSGEEGVVVVPLTLARRSGARVQLVCLPYLGGYAPAFASLASTLPVDTDVLAVELNAGTQLASWGASALPTAVPRLAAAVIQALRAHLQQDKVCALYGHSFGAVLAHEVARQWPDNGTLPPLHIAICAAFTPPHVRDPFPTVHTPAGTLSLDPATSTHDALFLSMLQRLGTPDELLRSAVWRSNVLPAIRWEYVALKCHLHNQQQQGQAQEQDGEGRLAHPVLALVGRDDADVTAALAASWAATTKHPCPVETVPGGHLFLADPQGLTALAAILPRHWK